MKAENSLKNMLLLFNQDMILIFILINFFQLVYEFFLRFLESPDFQPTIGNPSHIYYIYSYLMTIHSSTHKIS